MEENIFIVDFKINGQKLTCIKPSVDLTENSVGYLRARFDFSDDWNGLYKMAIFQSSRGTYAIHANEEDAVSGDGTFIIPYNAIIAPGFKISLVATDIKIAVGEDSRLLDPYLKTRITTNQIFIGLKQSGPLLNKPGDLVSDEVDVFSMASLALEIAKNAYTIAWDIQNGLEEISGILGGPGYTEYVDIQYREDGVIELTDINGNVHLLRYELENGKVTKTYLDGIPTEVTYDGNKLSKVGDATVDISGIFN